MEWLEQNLGRSYPFVDNTTDPAVFLFGDANISCGQVGPYTLTIFQPNTLTNAHVKIMVGATIVLETFVATSSNLGQYLVLVGADAGRGSQYQLILDPTKLPTYTGLAGPIRFDPAACTFTGASVSSINGLLDDITVSLPDYCTAVIDGQVVTVEFQDPASRVDCSAPDCGQIFTINGQTADQFGSFVLSPDGCLRAVPDVTSTSNRLWVYDFCTPCLNCHDVVAMDNWLASATVYNHRLCAIHGDQFNRYQTVVGLANQEILAAVAAADVQVPNGMYSMAVRAFNRPYFSQLVVSIANNTEHDSTAVLTPVLSIVDDQFSYIPNSALLQQFRTSGPQFTNVADPLVTPTVVHLGPLESATMTMEVQRTNPNSTDPAVGLWTVTNAYSFNNGPTPLPSPGTITKTATVEVLSG
jgi:hypothetical protein